MGGGGVFCLGNPGESWASGNPDERGAKKNDPIHQGVCGFFLE